MRKLNLLNLSTVVVIFMIIPLTNYGQSTKNKIDPSEKKYSIENAVNQFSREKSGKTKSGYRYWFADKNFTDGSTIKMSVVEPNQATHPPHRHVEDEFFFVLEGKAEFYLDGKTKIVEGYTSLYCPSNSEHGIKNAGDGELKYLVMKKYPQ